nr:TldD/PmbA family protein [Clostridia bacterium]
MVKFDILKNIVRDCSEKRGIDEYELYYSESSNIGASTFRDELNSFSSGVGGSLLYRCIVGGKIGYASTQLLDESEMEKLVERALENASVIEKDEEAIIFEGAPADEYHNIPEISFELPSASVIRERVMKNRDLLYAADERIADGTAASVSAGQSRTFLFNSKGLDLSSSGGSLTESFYTVLDNGSEKKTGGERLYNSLDKSDDERREKIAKAVKEASDKFGAGAVRSGRYNIVFKNEQMEQILDTFASVFFADKVQKGLSLLKGKVGEKIASECITITDDPFAEDNVYQHSFDGEGVPTYCKNVVEKG